MITAFPLLKVKNPTLVYKIKKYLAAISGFELIPPEDITAYLQYEGFTETSPVNIGWVAMGNEGRVTIDNLGSFFLIMLLITVFLIFHFILFNLSPCSTSVRKLKNKIDKRLFWSFLLTFNLEGYLGMALSVLANC
jgi:hypothetical protein